MCSKAHQSLLALPPSIWCAAVAVPHVNPAGNARPSPSPSHRRVLPLALGSRAARYRSLTMTSHSSPMTDVPDSERTGTARPQAARAASPMVEAHGLVKRFGDFVAVDGVDFSIAKGESFGFLGPNGAGKTSTMRMISCISPLSGGTLRVLGMDPAKDGPAHPVPHGPGAPGGLAGPRAHRARQPDDLRALLRHAQEGDPRAGRAAARLRPADRAGQRPGRPLVGRHEAAPHHRPRAHLRPGPAHPRRADHRSRPAGPPPAVGPPLPPEAGRGDAGDHHALHGRGRAALRPPRRHGQGPVRRRGLAAPAD